MPYAKFDDRYDDHKKIKRALRRQPAAVAMHAMAITYANRHNTNGEIDLDWIEERLALMPYKPAQRQAVLDVLLDLQLFERRDAETFLVHDFLDWNLSREQRQALADQGRKGGLAKSAGSTSPDSPGSGPGKSNGLSEGSSHGLSEGSSHGLSEGSSQSENGGLSTPRHATPTPRQAKPETRKRAIRQVDQSRPPDDFPADQLTRLDVVLGVLHRIWDVRGGIEPQQRGAGLAMQRNPRADHVTVARKLEHWLLAGNGQRAACKDVAARFGDWVANEPASKPGQAGQISGRPNAGDLVRKLRETEEAAS